MNSFMAIKVENLAHELRSTTTTTATTTRCFSTRRLFLLAVTLAAICLSVQNLSQVSNYLPVNEWDEFLPSQTWTILESMASPPTEEIESEDVPDVITIAYAISVTNCSVAKKATILDSAAVLHQSIRLVSRNSTYDYHMIAFVHPVAQACVPTLQLLGYEIQIRDTPFNDTDIRNPDLALAQGNSCCGTSEYLKLYSYLQTQFPVVVHLDLDCLVLQPLDDIFDLMLNSTFDRSRIPIMWLKPEEIPNQVDFVFTRDYGMVEPGVRNRHQIGVQGGFLIFRPNETDFHRNIEIIRSGADFELAYGWGGRDKAYGGYYGAGTIQGLASYYYGDISPSRGVELNRCYFNNMVDDPYGDDGSCHTLEKECQDCREVNVEQITTAHFTNCGKPYSCTNPMSRGRPKKRDRLCMQLFREWHLVRLSLENEWSSRFPTYQPIYAPVPDTETMFAAYQNFTLGHCTQHQYYIAMKFPLSESDNQVLIPNPKTYQEVPHVLTQVYDVSIKQVNMTVTISEPQQSWTERHPDSQLNQSTFLSIEESSNANKTIIAYAVSVTGCNLSNDRNLLDGAVVLHQSIRLASFESKYGYQMIAFVHPDATDCAPLFTKLGFDVQIRDTPFNESEIPNEDLIRAQGNSCCGAKEYLKLYSYVLKEYPVVVHMDLDTIMLKPMDDVFDLMLDPSFNRSRIDAMWLKSEEFPQRVDFLFTRDYNMVDPGRRQPHQIGVQGGFLVVRPNETDFKSYIDIIMSGGDFKRRFGWGGKELKYGGYYGAATIQGLASYYYGHIATNRSVELNRCYYDAMVDSPMGADTDSARCRTLEETCQDCRTVNVSEIFTAHFTICKKPFTCRESHQPLCRQLHHKWHLVRLSLEKEWEQKFPGYTFEQAQSSPDDFAEGHCRGQGPVRSYIPLKFPADPNGTSVQHFFL